MHKYMITKFLNPLEVKSFFKLLKNLYKGYFSVFRIFLDILNIKQKSPCNDLLSPRGVSSTHRGLTSRFGM